MFQKLNEPHAADLGVANERLNAGLGAIDAEVLRAYRKALPKSQYTVMLIDVIPQLVTPGSTFDYFSHEQVATWGVDPVMSSPENPATPYYRTFETPVGPKQHLYEFMVPMVPPTWNDEQRVAEYSSDNSAANPPTAVAYSLLDVIQPAVEEGDDYYEHWVLSHFLLDGHHKVQAAATAGRPIRLLSLVDENISIASPDELGMLAAVRSKPRRSRN